MPFFRLQFLAHSLRALELAHFDLENVDAVCERWLSMDETGTGRPDQGDCAFFFFFFLFHLQWLPLVAVKVGVDAAHARARARCPSPCTCVISFSARALRGGGAADGAGVPGRAVLAPVYTPRAAVGLHGAQRRALFLFAGVLG